MPNFYYNIRDSDEGVDVQGDFERPDLEAAKIEAKRAAVDSLSDRFPASLDLTVDLFDETGSLVCTAHIVFTTEER